MKKFDIKKLWKRFLKFDRIRWIIFIIIFLIFPLVILYPSSPCKLFHKPGFFMAICSMIYPSILSIPFYFIEIFLGNIPYGYFIIFALPNILVNLVLSFIISYPINLLYKKLKKK